MWRAWIGAGILWVLVTAWFLAVAFERSSVAVAGGLIAQPSGAQTFVAALSAVVFGLPGVALVVAGWRRRSRKTD